MKFVEEEDKADEPLFSKRNRMNYSYVSEYEKDDDEVIKLHVQYSSSVNNTDVQSKDDIDIDDIEEINDIEEVKYSHS